MLKVLLIFGITLLMSIDSFSQTKDLRKHKDFFEKQKTEYNAWLEATGLDFLAQIDHLEVYSDKVLLYLSSNFATDDSLKRAWKSLEEMEFNNRRMNLISERMFDELIFQFDLNFEEAELIIKGRELNKTEIRISYNEYLRVEENFPNMLGNGIIEIPVEKLNFSENNFNHKIDQISVPKTVREVGNFIKDYYEGKGTNWYVARIDTSRSYYNEIIYRITCLNKEIIQEGYFEFIQLKVKITKQDDTVFLQYGVLGKYASGIRCPEQKTKFYKSMETYFPQELEDYTNFIRNKLESLLVKH